MANSAVVGILKALLVADTAQFDQALKNSADAVTGWSKTVQGIGQTASTVGGMLTAALSGPLVALGTSAVGFATAFESSFATVRQSVDASEAEFRGLADAFLKLSTEIPVTAGEITKLGAAAGELGVAAENLPAFVKTISAIGSTTDLAADKAGEAITKLGAVFGTAEKDADRFGSALVELGGKSANSERQIADLAVKIGAAGKAIGLSEDQVLGFASALSSIGATSGAPIERFFLQINDAALAGGKALEGFAKVAGQSVEDFRHAVLTDAGGAITAFIEGLGKITAAGGNIGPILDGIVGKNAGLKDSLIKLAEAGSLVADHLDTSARAWRENTALTDAAAKGYETTAGQLKLLWNQIEAAGTILGQAFKPALDFLIKTLQDLTPVLTAFAKWFADLPGWIQAVIIVLPPLIFLLGQLAIKLVEIQTAATAAGFEGLAAGIGLLLNPVTLAIAGLGLLAVGIYSAANAQTELDKEVRSGLPAFDAHTKAIKDALETYDKYKGAAHLTEQQTRDLEDATRTLADASGMTAGKFKEEAEKSDTLTAALREQIKARGDASKSELDAMISEQGRLTADLVQKQQLLQDYRDKKGIAPADVRPNQFLAPDVKDLNATEYLGLLRQQEKAVRDLQLELAKLADEINAVNGIQSHNLATLQGTYHVTVQLTEAERADAEQKRLAAEAARKKAEADAAAAEAARKALEAAQAAIDKAGFEASVAGTQAAIKKLSDTIVIAGKNGGVASEKIAGYVLQLEAWRKAGYQLTAAEEDFRQKNIDVLAALVPVENKVKDLLALFPNVAREVTAAGDAEKKYQEALDGIANAVGRPGGAIALLNQFKGVVLGPPPPDRWTAGAQRELGVLIGTMRELEQQFRTSESAGVRAFGQIAGAAVELLKDIKGGGGLVSGLQAIGGPETTAGLIRTADAVLRIAGALVQLANGTQTASRGMNTLNGIMAGAQLGTAVSPGWGTLAGGLIGGLFGASTNTRIIAQNQISAWADAMYGGLDKLEEKLAAINQQALFDKLWKSKNAETMLATIPEITRALQDANEVQQKIAADNAKLAEQQRTALGKLQGALEQFGGVIPPSLRDLFDRFKDSVKIPDDLKQAFDDLSGDPSWQTLEQKAKDLGIDLAALGPKFNQARIKDIAFGYIHDIEMFSAAGADLDGVLRGMSDELSNVYQTAAKTGVALPSTLKPYMQKLVDMGLLVDENGNKIKDLDGIKFEDMEDTALGQIKNILIEIKGLLEKSLPKAADDGGAHITDTFNGLRRTLGQGIDIPVRYLPGDGGTAGPGPAPAPGPQPGPESVSGGYLNWADGTTFATGGSAVGETVTGAGAPVNITVVSQLDGREVARNQIRYIPGELTRAGV